jgi:hypothetical protein
VKSGSGCSNSTIMSVRKYDEMNPRSNKVLNLDEKKQQTALLISSPIVLPSLTVIILFAL